MKIISKRLGYSADHSSSSYEFVALEKRLSKYDQEKLASMGVDTNSYHGTTTRGNNMTKLLKDYYDVMYEVEYDYTTVGIALNVENKSEIEELQRYEFESEDERGSDVWIQIEEFRDEPNRVIVWLYAELYFEKLYGMNIESNLRNNDDFLKFLSNVHDDLKDKNYDALYAFVEKYGTDDDLDCVETLKNKNSKSYKLMKMILND